MKTSILNIPTPVRMTLCPPRLELKATPTHLSISRDSKHPPGCSSLLRGAVSVVEGGKYKMCVCNREGRLVGVVGGGKCKMCMCNREGVVKGDHSNWGCSSSAIANFRFVFFSSEPLKDL